MRDMKVFFPALLCALTLGLAAQAMAAGGTLPPRRTAAEMLPESGDLHDPEVRRAAVGSLRQAEEERRTAVQARGLQLGLPLREALANGGARELMDFDGDRPLYYATCNVNAGISSGANVLWAAPYNADGSGGTVGLWDASSARTTHQEFGGRVTSLDGASATYDHSSHVAGTICAAGVMAAAKGMAPAVRVDSYDWTSDTSEMTSRGASYPGEAGMINISSHSYGHDVGWSYTATPTYTWYGSGSTATSIDNNFGMYNSYARDTDSLAYSLPYYLIFWAAGNDRGDNPATGASVSVGGSTVTYDPALHPAGDGAYRGGYDTISYNGLAKNIVTVGAVNDAVSGSTRSLAGATMTSFSSWGPTDDGRIKPDLVANGYSVYSSLCTSDSAYGYMSGTSMATPSAAGTAQLLVHEFGILFTNQYMRASTLKALLIHTADDLGTAGPDYQFGWGLLNAVNAASLLRTYKSHPGTRRVIEDRVATNRTSVSFSFTWDGASPIRATLCWTDPAGASTTSGDLRTARLVNNLDLRLIGPSGTVYQPWVMPFVGNWTTDAFATAATTGSNYTDNVEQVLVASPGTAGTYVARVTFAGTLTNDSQPFSLLLSGEADADTAGAPRLTAASPASGTGTQLFSLTGDRLLLGGTVKLTQARQPDVTGAGVEVFGDTAKARITTTGLAAGWWNLVFTNPDGQAAVLTNAFGVPRSLWSENFETNNIGAKGWTFLSTVGSSQWALSSARYVSATRSLFSAGVATTSDTSAVSPSIHIPSGASGLSLSFWHYFSLSSRNDGGVLELSLDGGAWLNVTNSVLGASFVANGYNATLSNSSNNPLGKGCSVWSGNSGSFVQVQVSLTKTSLFAGHGLRIRWRLGTNSSISSTGWYIDDVALSGVVSPSKGTVLRAY